jgi:hypothetical protein
MRFSQTYPDFAAIEAQVKFARAERSLAIAQGIADALAAIGGVFSRPERVEAERRHIASDAFLKRSIQ